MDNKLSRLIDKVEKENAEFLITLLVEGRVIIGKLVDQKTFFDQVEQFNMSGLGEAIPITLLQYEAWLREVFQSSEENQSEAVMLHLVDVTFLEPQVIQLALPGLRVDAGRVSAWSFGVPYLKRQYPEKTAETPPLSPD